MKDTEPADESPRGSSLGVLTVALGVVVALLAAGTVWLGYEVWQGNRDRDQREKAAQSARQMGVNLMSVDYTDPQKALDRILSGAAGDLKNQLATQGKVFVESVTKAKAQTTVTDVDAAVVSMDSDSAEVMVSLNSLLKNRNVPNGTSQPYRYLMDLSRNGDKWLVSKLRMVP
ncbi:hypothetical protein [Spirillospora sp. CA-294931]|uniref:hypothetical protein n=1 Tax=Spirillospora sp. CA-294931 TaxID=3240042 RepID=UPI003D92C36B